MARKTIRGLDKISGKLDSLGNSIFLCMGILEREKNGHGPENPETLRLILENHKTNMLDSITYIKNSAIWREEELEHIGRLRELVEKFDLGSLEQARDIIRELK